MTPTTNALSYLADVAPELVDILASPEDDTPRLIYADWLQDHGEPERAAMLRMGRHTEIHADAFGRLLAGVMNFKQSMVIREMIAKLTASMTGLPSRIVVSRGFIAEVHAPLAVLEQHLPALVREHPIERVRAVDKEPHQLTTTIFSWWNKDYDGRNSHRTESRWLPGEVFNLLDGGKRPDDFREARDYPTAEAAHEALSRALLGLAKV